MENFHENIAAGAALARNLQFPDISVEEIGFLEQVRATGCLVPRLRDGAPPRCLGATNRCRAVIQGFRASESRFFMKI